MNRATLLLLVVTLALVRPSLADPLADAPPRPLPGPYPVSCSNVAQDFSRVTSGEPVELYWEGYPRGDGSTRYVTDLLADPGNTLTARVAVPNDRNLFGPAAGQTLDYPFIACYPTSAANTRANYALPNGKVVPRMQRGGDAPILPDATSRWPLLAFSHGYGGSPLSNDYLEAISVFASYGYIVIAPFHGDPRFALLSPDQLSQVVLSIANFERYTAMQSTRPLSISAAVDVMLAHAQWRDRVDPNRIGGFGASQGGETMMLLGGAELTTSIFLSSRGVTQDSRFKAAVGYVPYFGQRILPAFGRDNAGTEGVTLPFLAISGTADTTAPIGPIEDGMQRLAGSRAHVALVGVRHGFDEQGANEIFTWSLEWLDALVAGDRAAHARVTRLVRVQGGRDEELRRSYVAPAPEAGDERRTVEFYNAALDHYFVTAEAAEIAMLDAGVLVPGWRRTGFDFKTWAPGSGNGTAACRFFGTPGRGPNSHFFTIDQNECTIVRANADWTDEGLAFQATLPGVGTCASDRVVVWRLYNNGMRGQANHRFVTSYSEVGDMTGRGWLLEGPVFCTPP
jgi:hypothetical protein